MVAQRVRARISVHAKLTQSLPGRASLLVEIHASQSLSGVLIGENIVKSREEDQPSPAGSIVVMVNRPPE